jgi:hypothetical protein
MYLERGKKMKSFSPYPFIAVIWYTIKFAYNTFAFSVHAVVINLYQIIFKSHEAGTSN